MAFNAKQGKLVILGFDGMDFDLSESLIKEGYMPNLKNIIDKGCFSPLKSVFPPDSIPSWITAYTGQDPSQHGIIDHVNYLIKGEDKVKIDTSVFHGKTFWDEISSNDNEVCIINPFMAYPVWDVKGVMVNGPVFIDGKIQTSNSKYLNGISIPNSIGGIVDLPSRKNIEQFFISTIEDTEEQAKFGLELLKSNNSKLFFQTFLTTDRIQHHLWRYTDKSDPTYPGKTKMDNSIQTFFTKIDDVIGDFNSQLSSDDLLIIMSDHGHGMRCTHTFNLNEYFRQENLLFSNKSTRPKLRTILVEKLKNFVLSFMMKHDLEDYMHVVARFVPNAKKLKKGEHLTKSSNTLVKASSFAGVNPFGGIDININDSIDYEEIRDLVINKLSPIKFNNKNVFKWIKRREEIYNGKEISKYPDLLFEMIPELGTGMSMYSGFFSENPTHGKVSGGHKQNGVFIINRDDIDIDMNICKVENFYASILSQFGINNNSPDKKSFLS